MSKDARELERSGERSRTQSHDPPKPYRGYLRTRKQTKKEKGKTAQQCCTTGLHELKEW